MGMNKDHTVEELLAEIADSAAREADFRNRAEVAEAKLHNDDEVINPEVYRIEDGHTYEESAWSSLKEAHKCHLCGSLEEFHMEAWKHD